MIELNINWLEAEATLHQALVARNFAQAEFAAKTAIWLEACDYPGLSILQEALLENPVPFILTRTTIGIDLQAISCVHIGPQIISEIRENGRVYLRNVRHGLFLLMASVEHNFGIGCPVDPGFAIGGERIKNPYLEKLALAHSKGLVLDAKLWQNLIGQN
jgi:hypothetical protein